jgi:hypothetical protein
VDAVRCGVEIQRGMVERNSVLPSYQRIEFRTGINLGDVIAEDHDIFGDGVNIAARLEALAEPGGESSRAGVRASPLARYGLAGVWGTTAGTPSGLMLKARKVNGSLPGLPHWWTRPNGS